ncbi:MAG: hypothetical protein GWN12_09830 [Thermoplasmata archaeon]|nr:hypothetical protein [Thermoplasmata archaeon]NIT78419.1 hypothetical protein [Thermoplasmata archaeon]NIW89059.1 hypothetical protein [Thermoplasmata archaeon]NIY04788.1 hypothetical protein [Thermoplasmata archaeon]
MTRRHRTQLQADDIKDASIATQDLAAASVTAAKMADDAVGSAVIAGSNVVTNNIKGSSVQVDQFGVLRDHGTVAGVTATGRYKSFHTAFGGAPNVVVTGEGANARMAQAPAAGSFKAELDAAGTAPARYVAWGSR